MTETTLMDVPTGIVTFHMDMNEPRVPGKSFHFICLGHTGNPVCCKPYLYTQENISFELPAIPVLNSCLIAFCPFPMLLAVTKL
jgi:hypothetical protein